MGGETYRGILGFRVQGLRFIGFIWGFPKIRGTLLGIPIIRIIVYWGLYGGPLILGNYHIGGDIYGHIGFRISGPGRYVT